MASDWEPWVLARDRVRDIDVRLRVKYSEIYRGLDSLHVYTINTKVSTKSIVIKKIASWEHTWEIDLEKVTMQCNITFHYVFKFLPKRSQNLSNQVLFNQLKTCVSLLMPKSLRSIFLLEISLKSPPVQPTHVLYYSLFGLKTHYVWVLPFSF